MDPMACNFRLEMKNTLRYSFTKCTVFWEYFFFVKICWKPLLNPLQHLPCRLQLLLGGVGDLKNRWYYIFHQWSSPRHHHLTITIITITITIIPIIIDFLNQPTSPISQPSVNLVRAVSSSHAWDKVRAPWVRKGIRLLEETFFIRYNITWQFRIFLKIIFNLMLPTFFPITWMCGSARRHMSV